MVIMLLVYANYCDRHTDSDVHQFDFANITEINLKNGNIQVVDAVDAESKFLQVKTEAFGTSKGSRKGLVDVHNNQDHMSVFTEAIDKPNKELLGYDIECTSARVTAYVPSADIGFRMVNVSTTHTVFANITHREIDYGSFSGGESVVLAGYRTSADGALHVSNTESGGAVSLNEVSGRFMKIDTLGGAIDGMTVTVLEGGALKVHTESGVVKLFDVYGVGNAADIEVTSATGYVEVHVNGRFFHGTYNLQSAAAVAYIVTNYWMVYRGSAPDSCR
jgi:hypothetical protein